MSKEKQIEEMTCEKCLHYEMCLEKFRNAKKDGFCEFVDEEEYFSHADECDFFVTGYRKQSENVIEVPCKIGDTVYVVSQGAGFSCVWNVYKSRVTAIHLDRYNKLFVFTETERENVGGYVEVERVFNTKEEAEQALEKIIEKMKGGAE